MNLVYDVYPVFGVDGGKIGVVDYISYIVNTVVACRVKLHNVKNRAVINTAADFTLVAGAAVHRVQAVDCFCKNFCAGGLARAS